MSLLSQDVANGAPAHAIEYGGVRYSFRHFGLPELAEFERERYKAERDGLRLLRDDYPEAAYVERLDGLRRRYEAHEFAFESDPEFIEKPEGVLLILRVMTGRSDAENWRLFCALPEEVGAVMNLVISESFPKVKAGPKGDGPAAS